MFQQIAAQEEIPNEWAEVKIASLLKKGTAAFLTSIISKIREKVLVNKMDFVVSKHQNGALVAVIDNCRRLNQPAPTFYYQS